MGYKTIKGLTQKSDLTENDYFAVSDNTYGITNKISYKQLVDKIKEDIVVSSLTVTQNGTYNPSDVNADFFNQISVQIDVNYLKTIPKMIDFDFETIKLENDITERTIDVNTFSGLLKGSPNSYTACNITINDKPLEQTDQTVLTFKNGDKITIKLNTGASQAAFYYFKVNDYNS